MKRKGVAAIIISIFVIAAAAFSMTATDKNADNMQAADKSEKASVFDGWIEESTTLEAAEEKALAQDDDWVSALMDQKDEEPEDPKNVKPEEESADPDEPFDVEHPELMDEVEYSEDTLNVKISDSFNGKVNREMKKAGIEKLEVIFETKDHVWYTAYLKKGTDTEKALKEVRELKHVAVAEYNYKYEATADSMAEEVKNNTQVTEQYYLNNYGISETWDVMNEKGLAGGSSSVVVAVIDTGVDYNHEDLKANMWYNVNEIPDNNIDDDNNGYIDDYYGCDMTADDGTTGSQRYNGSAMDDNGHGTHVAGIIAASNNKTGVVGIAYNTKVMPIKAGDASGYFLNSNIAESIIYAYEHGADVINMSFGGSASATLVQDALETAYPRCVLVASAGNSGTLNEKIPNYPAAYSFVMGVMSARTDNGEVYESTFTNLDTVANNKIEYEVYAPGESILSTIPGDRYAKMSGTSMAAPVVAAQAALLRSMYTDMNTYPTKFIYAQIAGTADEEVKCVHPYPDPRAGHNVPGVSNFYKSLTEMPKPEIGVGEYTLFDTEEFEADTAGVTKNQTEKNNGDGIVDSGEVIAIGMTLKNRWGMSEDTTISIDVAESNGIENPYATVLNDNVNIGSVGTYSESDNGKIYVDGLWTGWENPIYVKIADNCPNNYTITLDVNVTYKNGLDETDTTVYTAASQIILKVRRGVVLPSVIKEDTTLTKDNYYIVENNIRVQEGATLKIEEGTQIQFWCSDPEDAYAQSGVACIQVNGKLISEGTEEEPVEMFPSDWRDNYVVRIYTSGDGTAILKHTNVTNPYLNIDRAENCTFTQMYLGDCYNISDYGSLTTITPSTTIAKAYECAFYRMNISIDGRFWDKCIFVDCAASMQGELSIENTVFYGNNTSWHPEKMSTSGIMNIYNYVKTADVKESYVDEETGTTYLRLHLTGRSIGTYEAYQNCRVVDRFAKTLGGRLLSVNDAREHEILEDILIYDDYEWAGSEAKANEVVYGVEEDIETGKYYNFDGTEVILPFVDNDGKPPAKLGEGCFYLNPQGLRLDSRGTGASYGEMHQLHRYIIEIPGKVHISKINLEEYIVTLDAGTTRQIEATVTPIAADVEELIFESENEAVATVDENGLITAVSQGSTNIRVYAPDRAVQNYVTVNVSEKFIPEKIKAAESEMTIGVGNSSKIAVEFTPVYTTEKALTFESKNPSIASVDKKGVVTANKVGETEITITGHGGITETVTVNCEILAESISFEDDIYVTDLNKDDGDEFYPAIAPAETTQTEIEWTSSDPDVCYVNEDGKLVKKSAGIASLKATVLGSDLYDTITIAVSVSEIEVDVVKMFERSYKFALMKDGSLWYWQQNVAVPTKVPGITCKDVVINTSGSYGLNIYILDKSGTVSYYTSDTRTFPEMTKQEGSIKNVKALSTDNYADVCFAITDEAVWGWGTNAYGGLGNGTRAEAPFTNPTQVPIYEPIVKITANSYYSTFLAESGNLYRVNGKTYLPEIAATDVKDAWNIEYIDYGDRIERLSRDSYSGEWPVSVTHEKTEPNEKLSDYYAWYIKDGKVYIKDYRRTSYPTLSYGEEFVELEGIENAETLYAFNMANIYVQTTDNKFYALGQNSYYQLGDGTKETSTVPVNVVFGLADLIKPLEFRGWNCSDEEILTEEEIVLDYNLALETSSTYGNISLKDSDGAPVAVKKEIDLNKLIIKPLDKLENGERYTLTLPADALAGPMNTSSEAKTINFTKQPKDYTVVSFSDELIVTEMDEEISINDFYPAITPVGDHNLVWTSSDEEICKVGEDGNLIKSKAGIADLKAQVKGKDAFGVITVAVIDEQIESEAVKMVNHNASRLVLMEDGTMWTWGRGYMYPQKVPVSNVEDFMVYNQQLYILETSGKLTAYSVAPYYVGTGYYDYTKLTKVKTEMSGIAALADSNCGSPSFFAITYDGKAYAWGENSEGQLGIGTTEDVVYEKAGMVEIEGEEIVQIVTNADNAAAFRTESKKVYAAGAGHNVPEMICGKEAVNTGSVSNEADKPVLDIYVASDAGEDIYLVLEDNLYTWTPSDWAYAAKDEISPNTTKFKYHDYYTMGSDLYIRDNGGSTGYKFGSSYVEIGFASQITNVFDFADNVYVQTKDGEFYALGKANYGYALGNSSMKNASQPARVPFGIVLNKDHIEVVKTNIVELGSDDYVFYDNEFVVEFDQGIWASNQYNTEYGIKLKNSEGEEIEVQKTIDLNKLVIIPDKKLKDNETYTLTIASDLVYSKNCCSNDELEWTFVFRDLKVTNSTEFDKELLDARHIWNEDRVTEEWKAFVEDGLNGRFYSNVILNRLNDDDTSTWLMFKANSSSDYSVIDLGGNYWGTANKELIDKQILDYDDQSTLSDINEGAFLTEAPDNTYPFVTEAYLEAEGERTDTVGNQLVTFVVNFSRPMDTSIDLTVTFGSYYPYADYVVEGEYTEDGKQWRGEMKLTTIIENGYQYWAVSNGKAEGTSLKLYKDWGRFPFMIDTSSAQSMTMTGEATADGIKLKWFQDDFDTLAGYNIYRSTEKDGLYERINKTLIPADTKEWLDEDVMPGQRYYYSFTVMDTDLVESAPSGKTEVTAFDTMAPDIYHSPVYNAFTGSNLIISATVTDNITIDKATLYYKIKGTEDWMSLPMTNNNDEYSAVVRAEYVTTDGLEYYIEASDGISSTFKGSADDPYEVSVQYAVSKSDKGDVDGNGKIEVIDALMLLQATADESILTPEQFARADLNDDRKAESQEALRILMYVNGSIGSIL